MKIPNYTARFSEPVICVKPGRALLLKLCIGGLAAIGAPAVGVLIWAEVSGFNLNRLPWLPRLGLAALVVACAFGVYSSVREEQVEAKLSCFRDGLSLSYESYPSLWRQQALPRQVEVRYADVKQCIYARSRMKVSLYTRAYTLTEGDRSRKKTGTVSFSTLGASGTDFAALLEKHTSLKVLTK